jgi:hypothetical protein
MAYEQNLLLRRKYIPPILYLVFCCMLLCSIPSFSYANDFRVNEYLSIAPSSIPVIEDPLNPNDGSDYVGMTKLRWRAGENLTTTQITEIEIEVKYDSGFIPSQHIEEIHVYYEPQGGNGLFDRGDPLVNPTSDDQIATISGPYTFSFGDDTQTINIDESIVQQDAGGWSILWIGFDFANTADIAAGVSCRIIRVDWEDTADPTNLNDSETYPDEADHVNVVNKPVDDHEVTLTGTSTAPTSATQGDVNISMLKLDFDLLDTTIDGTLTGHDLYLDSIRLHKTGTPSADSDIDSGGVILYEDTDESGDLTPDDNPIASGTMGSTEAGYVTLSPPVDFPIHHTGASPHKTFFIAINISVTAGVANTLGLEVEDPSQDVVFIDLIDDINPISPNYATVSIPYVQEGYILSQTAISSGTLTISELVLDVQPPSEPIATNNRILPGSTDPVKIYIPEPAGGPNTKVTVQIYTTTGKRVATLVDNRPYSQIESQLPLLWYGKNSRQKNLGPGLYFIQVVSGNDKKVLKVLIVR